MTVDTKFLQHVQDCGWQIVQVDEDTVVGACRRAGCGVRMKMTPGRRIQRTREPECESIGQVVYGHEDLRKYLRPVRTEIALTIAEVEEIAGMTPDYLAKFEKDSPSKIPNFDTTTHWVNSLGHDLVVVPGRYTPLALRTIIQTRQQTAARANMNEYLERKRQESAAQVPSE